MLLLVLVGLLAQASAKAGEPKRIVVAGGDSFEPLAFLNADGEPDGIYADLWQLWSEKTGVAVELRLMAWAKTIPALLAGEVDAVDGVTYTPERAKFLDLSAPYTEIPSYIYFHESIGGVRELTDLAGFPVGVIGGSHVEDYLREKAPKLRPVPYANYEEIVRAATEGRLRVFVGEDPIIPFMFAKVGKRITFRQTEAPIISSDMRTAVRKGDTELLALIERGHKAITSAERQQIRDEWAGVSLTSPIPWRWLIGGSAVFIAGIALLFLWNTQLQKQVAAATQTLSESEEKYRELANSLPQFVFEMDEKGIITFANRNVFDFFGYTQNEFDKGFNALQMLIPEDQDRAMENIQRRLGGEKLGSREYTALRKDGSTLPVVVHVNPIIRENKSVGLRGIMIDITDRKRAEDELQKRETTIQSVFDAAPVGICIMKNREYQRANRDWCESFGYPEENLIGRTT
ncbi:MAG: transporter substrate-binding domain-containing protein, partial [Anaerolineales bacterium]|nr:transporter substrate-binding domain-containing protein [Anaerolineales bacterium]